MVSAIFQINEYTRYLDEKIPSKKLANFIIIEYSFIFWTRSAASEVYMSKLEVLTYAIVRRINTASI
jgi:hypothetical protein